MRMSPEKQKEFIGNPKYNGPIMGGRVVESENHNVNFNVILLPPGNLIMKSKQGKDFNVSYTTYDALPSYFNIANDDFYKRNKERIDNGAIVIIFLDGDPNSVGSTKTVNSTDVYCVDCFPI